MVTLDGRVLAVLFSTARVGYADRPNMSLVGIVDISQRVRLQERLQQVQVDFAHAARISILGELTASIGHEVNQPTAAISVQASAGLRWLDRAEPNLPEVRKCLEAVQSEAARARAIIARVRSMATRQTQEFTAVAMDDVVAEALGFLRSELQSRGVTAVHRRAEYPAWVLGDRTQLQQVLVNLLVNAIQAIAEADCENRRIVVSTRHSGSGVLCTVEDSGPGVEDQHHGRLFESFFTTKKGGMGMGLRICRTIVEGHEGQITADRAGQGGMRFSVRIPALRPARPGPEIGQAARPEQIPV